MQTSDTAPRGTLINIEDELPRWHDKAACRGIGPDHFYLSAGGRHQAAKRICATCPVLPECLDGSIVRNEEFGIFGGAGEQQRRYFRRLRLRRPHAEPGPVKGCRCGWCVELRRHVRQIKAGTPGWGNGAEPVPNRVGPGARHGLRASFAKGCRCHACTWSATLVGQLMARAALSTADLWERHSLPVEDYAKARRPVDEAAWALVVDVIVALLSLSPGRGPWTRQGVQELVDGRRTSARPHQERAERTPATPVGLHPRSETAAA